MNRASNNENAPEQPQHTAERSMSPLLDALSKHIEIYYSTSVTDITPAAGGVREHPPYYEDYPNPDIDVCGF